MILIKRHCATSFKELRNTIRDAQIAGQDYLAVLEGTFSEWQAERLPAQARDEAQRAGNALTMKLFMVYGIRKIRWSPKGSSCPMCRELSGKVVDIDNPFAVRGSKKHPPLHKGCDCGIEAEQTERGSTAGKDQVVPDEIKPKSASTPRYNKSNAVVDYVVGDALVDKRVFYDAEGKMIRQIHTNDHGYPKSHPFGIAGEHAHDFVWDRDVIADISSREVSVDERRKNAGILPRKR